jgi:hypothetical protein
MDCPRALSLVRDELDTIDMAAAVVKPPGPPVAELSPSQAQEAAQVKAAAPPTGRRCLPQAGSFDRRRVARLELDALAVANMVFATIRATT